MTQNNYHHERVIQNPYPELREVLRQALSCKNPHVFYRVLVGYAKDDKFWERADMDDLELINHLLEILVGRNVESEDLCNR